MQFCIISVSLDRYFTYMAAKSPFHRFSMCTDSAKSSIFVLFSPEELVASRFSDPQTPMQSRQSLLWISRCRYNAEQVHLCVLYFPSQLSHPKLQTPPRRSSPH